MFSFVSFLKKSSKPRPASSHPVDELLLEVLQNATHSEESPVPGSLAFFDDRRCVSFVSGWCSFSAELRA